MGEERKLDPQALMSKRVEAATQAMAVSKMVARRTVNFDDERLMRKLISKGLKHDKQWEAAYLEYCSSHGVVQGDEKGQSKEFIGNFIERNLGNSINNEWVQRILHPEKFMDLPMEKREKKRQKGQEKEGQKALQSFGWLQ